MEQAPNLRSVQPHACVGHGESQLRGARTHLHSANRYRYLTAVGKLDRVVHQIGQNLAQAQRVTDHGVWNLGVDSEQ